MSKRPDTWLRFLRGCAPTLGRLRGAARAPPSCWEAGSTAGGAGGADEKGAPVRGRSVPRRGGAAHATRRVVANFWQIFGKNVARFQLYWHRFLQENTRFAAFFKLYKIISLQFLKYGKILQILQHLQKFC